MEQFYQLLRYYNIGLKRYVSDLPGWFLQYTENEPPLYWKIVYEILKNEDKNLSIVEIGAGLGDITALLYFMGFRNILSFESEKDLAKHLEEKISYLFNLKANILINRYPTKLDYQPDIIIQVNCVYSENVNNKEDYLKQIMGFYQINGIPKIFVFESIDDSYQEHNITFPDYVRLNSNDVNTLFPNSQIKSFYTHKFPKNKVTKQLYLIKK